MHKISFMLIVAAFAATISLYALPGSDAATSRRIVVDIKDFEFQPGLQSVKPGDVIVWVNKDIVPHTVSGKDGDGDSGLIKVGESWEMVVDDDTFRHYFCKFHPTMEAGLEIATN